MLSCIVAIDKNYAIGRNNTLPWHLSDDLKLFKKITTRHNIIMGRKTFDSIGKPLPNRKNIVLTCNKEWYHEGCQIASFEDIKKNCDTQEEYFLIGGAEVYHSFFPFCSKLYLTQVDTEVESADSFFPKIDFSFWSLIEENYFYKDKKNDFNFTSSLWIKK